MNGHYDQLIVSSFHHFAPKRETNAYFVGPFISDILKEIKIENDNHITVYLKEPKYLEYIVNKLESMDSDYDFHIFSNWSRFEKRDTNRTRIKLFDIDRNQFLESLATSTALISTAGNQVIGEAIFMGKPILAFPKLNDLEQEINSIALSVSGFGKVDKIDELTYSSLQKFLHNMTQYKNTIEKSIPDRMHYDGSYRTLCLINEFIARFVNNDGRYVRDTNLKKLGIPANRVDVFQNLVTSNNP